MAEVRLPGGPTLSYQEWGRPDGAVVLMLHGLTSSGSTWRHVASALGEDFRVIAPDARGHGGSEWTRDYSVDAMVDDVVGFCEQVGILGAIVVGHSMGARHGVRAGGPASGSDPAAGAGGDAAARPGQAAPTAAPSARTGRHHRLAGGDRVPPLAERTRRGTGGTWPTGSPAETLVISGSQSYLPAERVEELSHRLPNGRFASLDLGHVPTRSGRASSCAWSSRSSRSSPSSRSGPGAYFASSR